MIVLSGKILEYKRRFSRMAAASPVKFLLATRRSYATWPLLRLIFGWDKAPQTKLEVNEFRITQQQLEKIRKDRRPAIETGDLPGQF
jgi:hypothetical protein